MSTSRATALVTGGAGFIGAHVVRALLEQQRCEPVILDDLSGGFRENLPPGVPFVEGSVSDSALVDDLFRKHKFRYVFHLAAYAAEGLSHFIRRFNYVNNVVGTVNLVNASVAHDVECFVFTSSIAVYGAMKPPLTEEMFPHPEDPYGIAKFAVELDLAAARTMWGLRSVIFRPHNVYGEYQNLGDPYRNVVGIFMNQIMNGEPLSIFGDGEQQRAFTHVKDIAPLIAKAPWTPGAWNEVFNIGADIPFTVNHLAACVKKVMGAPHHEVKHLPPRKEVVVAYSDHAKVERVFGGSAKTSLEVGLQRMADWAKVAGVRTAKPFEGIEVGKGLPPSWERLLRKS